MGYVPGLDLRRFLDLDLVHIFGDRLMTKQMMIDLETMGITPGSPILQIGVALFDKSASFRDQKIPNWSCNVSMQSCVDHGMTIAPSTVLWWLDQEERARQSLLASQTVAVDLPYALIGLTNWIDANVEGSISGIWANGATFDISIIEDAYRRVGQEPPWPFWAHRDVRTIASLYPEAYRPKPELAHDALSDTMAQTEWVLNCFEIHNANQGGDMHCE